MVLCGSVSRNPSQSDEPLVCDLMQVDVVTIDADANLDVAEKLMRVDRIEHLPVMSGGRLVGVLSQRDLFRACAPLPRRDPVTEVEWLAGILVREVMATQVFTARPDSTLLSAVEMMLLEGVGCLPVVEDEKLVGFISQTDCMRHLTELLRVPTPAR